MGSSRDRLSLVAREMGSSRDRLSLVAADTNSNCNSNSSR